MPSASEIYSKKTIVEIVERAIILDTFAAAIIKAVKERTEITDGREVLKQLAEAAQYCQQALEFYDEDDPMPQEVAEAMAGMQGSIADLVTAFLAYVTLKDLLA